MPKSIELKPITKRLVTLRIRSTAAMVQHAFSEKARRQILEKKQGKKTKHREPCDPEAEMEAATYRTARGQYGIPAMALKSAIISAAHNDLGIAKTLVQKALFIICDDPTGILPIECEPPVMFEAYVRVGQGTDIRFRPKFAEWACSVTFLLDIDLLQVQDLVTLINRAGFGVGICEMRPEKGGDNGRFEIDTTAKVEERAA